MVSRLDGGTAACISIFPSLSLEALHNMIPVLYRTISTLYFYLAIKYFLVNIIYESQTIVKLVRWVVELSTSTCHKTKKG